MNKFVLFAHSSVFNFKTREELENYKKKLAELGISNNYQINHTYGLFKDKKRGGGNERRTKASA